MAQATIEKKIQKTATELEALIKKAKRKLLEFEVAASARDFAEGRFKEFSSVDKLLKSVKNAK